MRKKIDIKNITIVLQELKDKEKYTIATFQAHRRVGKSTKLIVLVLGKGNLIKQQSLKEVYLYMRNRKKNKDDIVASTIKNLTENSHYINLFGRKDESRLINNYIENYNLLEDKTKSFKRKLKLDREIFLLDSDTQSNKYKWSVTEIKEETLCFIFAIEYALKYRGIELINALSLS